MKPQPPQPGHGDSDSRLNPRMVARLQQAAVVAAIACGLYYVAAFLFVALSRIKYPFALEWLEGGSYIQVHRLLTGQPLYARPDIQYVAMIYPPLYYFAAAGVARLTGLTYFPLRLVSLVSAMGAIGLIYLICRREGAGRLPAFLGCALFAAAYGMSGYWFDLARIDTLSVFLLLLSIWLLRFRTVGFLVAAGVVSALAALTKQTHLVAIACLGLFLLLSDWRRAVTFLLAFISAYAGAFLLLNSHYKGWYEFYVFKLALGSGEYVMFSPDSSLKTALGFWTDSVFLAVPAAVLIIIAWFVIELRSRADLHSLFFYAACGIGMVGTSWSVIQVGGYRNDLIPAYAGLALLFGLSLSGVMSELATTAAYRSAVLLGCIAQFGLLLYRPAPQIPSVADVKAGQDLVTRVEAQAGDVYLPWHPDIAIMAGKQPFASWSPMYQLEGNFGGGDIREVARVKTEFSNAMAQQKFSLLVLDQEVNWIWGHPERFYSASYEPVFGDPNVFWPVTGWQTRPTILMVPNVK